MVLLCVLTKAYGIEGTAIASVIRVTGDALGLLYFSSQFLPEHSRTVRKILAYCVGGAALVLSVAVPNSISLRIAVAVAVLIGVAVLGWMSMSTAEKGFAKLQTTHASVGSAD